MNIKGDALWHEVSAIFIDIFRYPYSYKHRYALKSSQINSNVFATIFKMKTRQSLVKQKKLKSINHALKINAKTNHFLGKITCQSAK